MQLEYNLEPRHFQDYSTASVRELGRVNGLAGQAIWGVVVGSVIAVLAMCAWEMTQSIQATVAFFVGAWTFWLINYLTTLYVVRRGASQAFAKDGLVLGHRSMSVDANGIHLSGDVFRLDVDWKALRSITVQHLVVVLWTDTAHGIFLPRSAFATRDEEKRFIAIIQARIAGGFASGL